MAITSSTLVSDLPQRDGRRWVTERHTWHDGVEQHVQVKLPAVADANAVMAARVPVLEAAALVAEKESVRADVARGVPIAVINANLRHHTPKQVLRWALRGFREADLETKIAVAKFIQANVSDATLDEVVGVVVRAQITSHIADVLASEVDIVAVRASEVDADG